MVNDVARLLLLFEGNSASATAALGEVAAGLEGVELKAAKVGGALEAVGGAMMGITKVGVVVGAIVAGITGKMAADFQQQTERLVTNAGEQQSVVDNVIRPALLRMAGDVGYSTAQLTEGMRMTASAGFHGAEGLQVLEVGAKAAKSEMADLGVVLNVLTSAMVDYNVPAEDAVVVQNTLVNAMRSGKLTLQDLSAALGTVLPAASASNVSLQETVAALATMTNEGTPAADAATYLRHAIEQLQDPSNKAKKALADIGLGATDVAYTLTHQGLVAAMEMLSTHIAQAFPESAATFDDVMAKVKNGSMSWDDAMGAISKGSPLASAALANIVGGVKGMAAALELGGTHLTAFKQNAQYVTDETRKAGHEIEGWKDIQGNFNFQFDRFKEGLNVAAITIGMKVLPVVTPLVQQLANAAAQFPNWFQWLTRLVSGPLGQFGDLLKNLLDTVGKFATEMAKGFSSVVKLTLQLPGGGPVNPSGPTVNPEDVSRHQTDERNEGHTSTISNLKPGTPRMGPKPDPGPWQAFGAIVGGVLRFLGGLWHEITKAIGEAWRELQKGFAQAGVLQNLNKLWEAAKPLIEGVGKGLGVLGIIILALLGGAWDALVKGLSVLLPAAVNVVIDIFRVFFGILNFLHDLIQAVGTFISDWVTSDWGTAWAHAGTLFKKVADDITHILEALADLTVHLFMGLINTVIALIGGFVEGVIGAFKHLYDMLVGHSIIPDLLDGILTEFQRLPGEIWDTITGWITQVETALTGMATSVLTTATTIGGNIVQGLKDGLTNAWDGLVSLLTTLADKLPAPVRKVLGVASPSTVFREIGKALPEGMALGVTDRSHLVTDALARLGGGAFSGSGGRLGSGAGVTLNQTINVSGLPETVVEQLRQEMADSWREFVRILNAGPLAAGT